MALLGVEGVRPKQDHLRLESYGKRQAIAMDSGLQPAYASLVLELAIRL